MTELDNIILDLCKREEEAGCYDYQIEGVSIYNLIRFKVRNDYIKTKGYSFVEKYGGVRVWDVLKSFIISVVHLTKIWLSGKKYDVMFYPFLRSDHVNGYYLDKFVDPIIDCCELDNYVIFERGRRGVHFRPRLHQSHVVYTNVLDIYFDLKAKFGRASFEKKHKNELDRLYAGIEKVMENKPFDRQYLTNRILYGLCKIRVYENIFHKLGIKKFFAPSRANLLCHICPAKRLGVEVFEFQHGITYGETALYSGFRDSDFTPDRFLAFGESQPRNVYGIDESKIYNIGWAFQDYIDKIQTGTKVGEHDILVISGPCLTDKILSATFRLAKESPDVHFVVRPHPAEVVTEEHRRSVEEYANVDFQDPKINVAVAMRPYQNIIGENSTVLYEALTYGKKVARFCFDGFAPRYLTPEDEECFWKVNDMASFKAFIEGKPEDKKSMKIYSKFDKELFMKIYNS